MRSLTQVRADLCCVILRWAAHLSSWTSRHTAAELLLVSLAVFMADKEFTPGGHLCFLLHHHHSSASLERAGPDPLFLLHHHHHTCLLLQRNMKVELTPGRIWGCQLSPQVFMVKTYQQSTLGCLRETKTWRLIDQRRCHWCPNPTNQKPERNKSHIQPIKEQESKLYFSHTRDSLFFLLAALLGVFCGEKKFKNKNKLLMMSVFLLFPED